MYCRQKSILLELLPDKPEITDKVIANIDKDPEGVGGLISIYLYIYIYIYLVIYTRRYLNRSYTLTLEALSNFSGVLND